MRKINLEPGETVFAASNSKAAILLALLLYDNKRAFATKWGMEHSLTKATYRQLEKISQFKQRTLQIKTERVLLGSQEIVMIKQDLTAGLESGKLLENVEI